MRSKKTALELSEGISSVDAVKYVDSEDERLRRRARMRLIYEHAEVKAAHSKNDGESTRERNEAFKMFNGNTIKNQKWTPEKRILANVDIFSEGVSIPEIDTVVITDDDKFNEQAMTQSIGRAIRTVPNNDIKKYGHVIIPEVIDQDGVSFNRASVDLAAYSATRVERAVIATKLRGDTVAADDKTTFNVYESNGAVKKKLAREFAQESVDSLTDIAVANEMYNIHQGMLERDRKNKSDTYKNLSRREQTQIIKSVIQERLNKEEEKEKKTPAIIGNIEYYKKVQERMSGLSDHELRNISRSNRVLSGALASGDVSSINGNIVKSMMRDSILSTQGEVAEITHDEKKQLLKKFEKEFRYAVLTTPPDKNQMSDHHRMAQALLGNDFKEAKKYMRDGLMTATGKGKETQGSQKLSEIYDKALENPEFVEHMFKVATESTEKSLPILSSIPTGKDLEKEYKEIEKERMERQHGEAESGVQEWTVDTSAVKKTGELRSEVVKRMILTEEWSEV